MHTTFLLLKYFESREITKRKPVILFLKIIESVPTIGDIRLEL